MIKCLIKIKMININSLIRILVIMSFDEH